MASSKLAMYDFSLIPSAHLPPVNPNIMPVLVLGRMQRPWSGGKHTGSVVRTLGPVLAPPPTSCASLGELQPPSACLNVLTCKMGSMI